MPLQVVLGRDPTSVRSGTLLNSAGLSPFVKQCLRRPLSLPKAVAADLGCGTGRHLSSLIEKGFSAVGLDVDLGALRVAKKRCKTAYLVQCDLGEGLPLQDRSLGLAVAVHVPLLPLIPLLSAALEIGGYAVLESVGGQGENWRELPKQGALRRVLRGKFEVIELRERAVGPISKRAVTVRALLRAIA